MKLAFLLMIATAQAAPFADPFRPPRQAEQPASGERAGPAAATRLESVLIAPDRRIAVINGQQYTEGARFGSGRVLRISEGEVVIRHADRDEALKLFPQGVRK
ncbi:MAG TPA: MSHA biogenesis protein MshK [Burkholderiales bacterium]|nr:MSHA biogenesis protein MshK [Burkholderiales bacterium]